MDNELSGCLYIVTDDIEEAIEQIKEVINDMDDELSS